MWKQIKPPGYVRAALIASLGGLLNGLDTGSIGAITGMPEFIKTFGTLSPSMRGFTVSLIMLTGAIPSFFAGQLSDRFGRLPIVGIGAAVLLFGVVLQAASQQLNLFLVGRAFAGLGEGLFLSNMSVYITEIAPSARRGVLAASPQLMSVTGICMGYFICYGTVKIASSASWRLPYAFQALFCLVLGVSCLLLPASPRWLVLHDRREEAMVAVERLDILKEEAEKDIFNVADNGNDRLESSMTASLKILFKRQYRAKTGLALFVLGMVQLSGIDGVFYYAPILFEQAGLPEQTAGFLASGISAILMLAVSIPAFLYADHWGRRTSAITGGAFLSACMLLIGTLYATDSVHPYGAARWVVVVLVFVFGLSYAATWGVVGKMYASEIQPAKTRAAASCVAQGLAFFTNWLVAFATPVFLANSSCGPYFLYGGLALGTMLVLAFYMPETRGRSLEAIQEAFHRPPLLSSLRRLLASRLGAASSLPPSRNGDAGSEDGSGSGSDARSVELAYFDAGQGLRVETAAVETIAV